MSIMKILMTLLFFVQKNTFRSHTQAHAHTSILTSFLSQKIKETEIKSLPSNILCWTPVELLKFRKKIFFFTKNTTEIFAQKLRRGRLVKSFRGLNLFQSFRRKREKNLDARVAWGFVQNECTSVLFDGCKRTEGPRTAKKRHGAACRTHIGIPTFFDEVVRGKTTPQIPRKSSTSLPLKVGASICVYCIVNDGRSLNFIPENF